MQETKKIIVAFILGSIVLLSNGCNTPTEPAKHGVAYDQIKASLEDGVAINNSYNHKKHHHHRIPTSVSNALLPEFISPSYPRNYSVDHRFNVAADKIPAKSFFMGLVEGTRYNMLVSPEITGNISLSLKNVTIAQTMEAVRDVYGYDYRRTSLGYEVFPAEMQTKIFNVNYLDIMRKGKTLTELSSGEISEQVGTFSTGTGLFNQPQVNTGTTQDKQSGSRVDTKSEMDFWKGLQTSLVSIVGSANGRSIVVNRQSGVIIIHAFPREIRHVTHYLNRIQNNMERQVILEAKILEVQLNDQYQAGIDWNIFGKGRPLQNEGGVAQTADKIFETTDLRDFESIFTMNLGKGSFNVIMKLLQTQGNLQVLSSPRLSTVNNQKAVIKVGQDEFFVTGVSTENTVTANSTIPTQDVSLTPFFSGITFDVTPQISGDDNIILHIHPSISTVKNQQKEIILGQTAVGTNNTLSLPLALSTIRESDNIVRAKSGHVIVIGGLMENIMEEQTAGTPVISRIPFIGAFFRRTKQVSRKTELVILLRPIVVKKQVWNDDLNKDARALKPLKRGFHYGGLVQVFGDEGERDGE